MESQATEKREQVGDSGVDVSFIIIILFLFSDLVLKEGNYLVHIKSLFLGLDNELFLNFAVAI